MYVRECLYVDQGRNHPLTTPHHTTKQQLFYTLDRPPTKWKQGIGFITPEMVKEHCPPYSARSLYLVCGPPAMYVGLHMHGSCYVCMWMVVCGEGWNEHSTAC